MTRTEYNFIMVDGDVYRALERDAEQALHWYAQAKEARAWARRMKAERDAALGREAVLRVGLNTAIGERNQAQAEIDRLRALLTEANTEILFWRKNAQDWHDRACPDRTKPFTVGVNPCDSD